MFKSACAYRVWSLERKRRKETTKEGHQKEEGRKAHTLLRLARIIKSEGFFYPVWKLQSHSWGILMAERGICD